jgi:2',3'-cyclic-nucleotide 2'-phosphodiesterase (5'-nucleotidase family)
MLGFRSLFVVAWLFGLASASCAPRPAPVVTPAEEHAPSPPAHAAQADLTLSFLGLNDLHGRLRALPGFAGYATNLRRARAADGGAVALVDAGDMFQGTLESNLTEGKSVLQAYRVLGMTVAALGNHEFDFGPEGDTEIGDPQGAIRARIREASFPILSANLVQLGTHDAPNWEKLKRSALLDIGGVRVGFVGLLTRETPSIVRAAWFAGLGVDELAPALEREARALRAAGAQVVVAVAHAGADCKDTSVPTDLSSCVPEAEIFDVARALPPGMVDAIFGGHSHAAVAQIVNGIPIAEAYARGRAFSRIDLQLDGSSHRVLTSHVFPPHDLCPKLADGGDCPLSDYEGQAVVEDPAILTAIAPALAEADRVRKTPLGVTISAPIRGEHGRESPLGNLFADLLREAVKGADGSIINGGTLRGDLPAGALDYGQLFEAMPFDNLVATIRVTGAQLKSLLVRHLSRDAHGIVSVSGFRINARCGRAGIVLQLTRDNGRAVSDRETLVLATSDYIATGGDDLVSALQLTPDRIQIEPSVLFRDALVRSLKRHPQLSPSDPALFAPEKPRLTLSSPRPITCSN